MFENSSYTGAAPNDFAASVIRALKAEGFKVAPTGQGPNPSERQTLRILWRGIYIAKMKADIWSGIRRMPPCACLYRFPNSRPSLAIAATSEDFDKVAFAEEHLCDPNRLHVDTESDGKSYLYVEDQATTLILMRDWARRIDEIFFPSTGNADAQQVQADLRAIQEDTSKSETERRAEMDARLGQGKFRAELMREFGDACAATRLAVAPVLRASHIHPWSKSNDKQRLDSKNGLLLSANLDALFDRHMITFRPDGKRDVSAMVAKQEWDKLGPIEDLRFSPCEKRAAYLRLHNAEFDHLEQMRMKHVSASEKS
jgi:hypothetical protein